MLRRLFHSRNLVRVVCSFLFLSSFKAIAQTSEVPFVVVLDAGHGGKDPGTLGTKTRPESEKDIVLDVALMTGSILNDRNKNIRVLYSRATDNFIELQERADFANANKADLFVSIHCNSAASKKIHGTNTYVLGLHKDPEASEVAKRENSVIVLEDNYNTKYKGFNPNSTEDIIAMTLQQSEHLENSIVLSDIIQRKINKKTNRKNRGVRQAGFWVLHQTAMPSVLVELGFLTNSVEEKYLHSEKGKKQMAESLADAIIEYVNIMMPAKLAVSNILSNRQNGIIYEAAKEDDFLNATNEGKPKPIRKKVNLPPPPKNTPSKTSAKQNSPTAQTLVAAKGTTYRIQLFALSRQLSKNDAHFKDLNPISFVFQKRLFKYFYGDFKSETEARLALQKIKRKGFKNAFLVRFEDGKKVK